jgi:hypothetical protein
MTALADGDITPERAQEVSGSLGIGSQKKFATAPVDVLKKMVAELGIDQEAEPEQEPANAEPPVEGETAGDGERAEARSVWAIDGPLADFLVAKAEEAGSNEPRGEALLKAANIVESQGWDVVELASRSGFKKPLWELSDANLAKAIENLERDENADGTD